MKQFNQNPYGAAPNLPAANFDGTCTNSVDQYQPTSQSSQKQPKPIFAEGNLLIIPSGTVLPSRCIKTNVPVTDDQFKRKTLVYIHPLLALFVCAGMLPFLIAYLVMQKKCTIRFGLSEEARTRYFRFNMICLAVGVASLFVITWARIIESGFLMTLSIFTLAITVFYAIAGNTCLKAISHSNGFFKIKGCCHEFIEQTLREQAVPPQKKLH